MTYISELRKKIDLLPETEVKDFLCSFFNMREMVYTILQQVPADKLGYKPANKKEVHDLRECFAELPRVELGLIRGLQTGKRKTGGGNDALPDKPTKDMILKAFEKIDKELFEIVTGSKFDSQRNIVWINKEGHEVGKSKAILMLYGLRNHENMHLGMIRRDLDAIGVEPSKEYIRYWYGG